VSPQVLLVMVGDVVQEIGSLMAVS